MRKTNYIYSDINIKQVLKQFTIIFVSCFFCKVAFAQSHAYHLIRDSFVVSEFNFSPNTGVFQSSESRSLVIIESRGLRLVSGVYENALAFLKQQNNAVNPYRHLIIKIYSKYGFNGKDKITKSTTLQKLISDVHRRFMVFGLLLTFLITIAVSILAFRLRRININLEKLTKNRDKLFTIISHDLRSPLNSYQRYAEIVGYLIRTKQFDRLDEALKKIDEIGLNLAALLNNLLEWSLVKQMPANTSVINVPVFFDGFLPIYRDMASLKKLTLVENFQNQKVKIDSHLLSLITRNLLDNAIKYAPEESEVLIHTYIRDTNLILMISNKGDSMMQIQREKIKALFNNDYDYEFGEEGLGIGLILIKEFAHSNDVKITFYQSHDNLTTFEVLIPNVFF